MRFMIIITAVTFRYSQWWYLGRLNVHTFLFFFSWGDDEFTSNIIFLPPRILLRVFFRFHSNAYILIVGNFIISFQLALSFLFYYYPEFSTLFDCCIRILVSFFDYFFFSSPNERDIEAIDVHTFFIYLFFLLRRGLWHRQY